MDTLELHCDTKLFATNGATWIFRSYDYVKKKADIRNGLELFRLADNTSFPYHTKR